MKKIKIMILFGTRPEAIKMAPLVIALKQDPRFQTLVTLTAQHREMLDQVLALFAITADYDLNLMKPGQTLSYLTASILNELKPILTTESPDMIPYMGCEHCHHEKGLWMRTVSLLALFAERPLNHHYDF